MDFPYFSGPFDPASFTGNSITYQFIPELKNLIIIFPVCETNRPGIKLRFVIKFINQKLFDDFERPFVEYFKK
jgi:hypothetical protein